jgi:hypothetical protein
MVVTDVNASWSYSDWLASIQGMAFALPANIATLNFRLARFYVFTQLLRCRKLTVGTHNMSDNELVRYFQKEFPTDSLDIAFVLSHPVMNVSKELFQETFLPRPASLEAIPE